MVEGAFARVFRSGLRPVEVGRRLTREMDDSRSIGVRGNTVVANDFTVNLSQQDADEFAEVGDSMRRNQRALDHLLQPLLEVPQSHRGSRLAAGVA